MILKFITGLFVGDAMEWELRTNPKTTLALIVKKESGTWLTRIFVPGIRVGKGEGRFVFDIEGVRRIPFGREVGHKVLVGRILPLGKGSRVVARLRLPIPSTVMTALVLTLAFAYGIAGAVIWVKQAFASGDMSQLEGAGGFCLLPIFAIAIANLLKRSGEGVERDLLEAFSETLEPYRFKGSRINKIT